MNENGKNPSGFDRWKNIPGYIFCPPTRADNGMEDYMLPIFRHLRDFIADRHDIQMLKHPVNRVGEGRR
jgi:hypothetical protein